MADIKFEYLDGTQIIEVPFSRRVSYGNYKRNLKYLQPKDFSDGGDIYIYDKGSKEYRLLAPVSDLLCEIQKANIQPGSGKDMRNDMILLLVKEY